MCGRTNGLYYRNERSKAVMTVRFMCSGSEKSGPFPLRSRSPRICMHYLLIGVTRCLQSEDIRIMALFRAPLPRLTIARPSESPGVLLGAGGERKFVCLRTEDEDISDKEIPKMGRNVRRGTRQVHLLLSRRPWNLAYVEI